MNYLTNTSELTAVADAIREKGGTSAPLTYPFGYVSAIQDIQTGGGDIDALIDRSISGTYENSTVTTIGTNAFRSCTALSGANFPNCTTISSYAFATNPNLHNVSAPKCTAIGSYAFASCSYLFVARTASFPACITIGDHAFESCTRLSDAYFPVCTTVGISAFIFCTFIKTLSFPECTYVGSWGFYAGKVTTVSLPKCTYLGDGAFKNQTNLTEITLPMCSYLGNDAFCGCFSLSTASFPAVETIGTYAFSSCYRLSSLYLMGSAVAALANSNAFRSTPIGGYSAYASQYGSIYVPASLLTDYQAATNWTYYSSRFVGV